MNGKNRRVKGCYSRGLGRTRRPQVVQLKSTPKSFYDLPVFDSSLKANLNTELLSLLNFFETYSYLKIIEEKFCVI